MNQKINFISLCLILLLFFSCANKEQHSANYKLLLSNFTNHSPYIYIDVKYKDSVYTVVIENARLYSVLQDVWSREEYQKIILSFLEKNDSSALKINKEMFDALLMNIVSPQTKIDSLFDTGFQSSISYLFNDNGALKVPLSRTEKLYLIEYLFKNGIFIEEDCESGLIVIKNKLQNNYINK